MLTNFRENVRELFRDRGNRGRSWSPVPGRGGKVDGDGDLRVKAVQLVAAADSESRVASRVAMPTGFRREV